MVWLSSPSQNTSGSSSEKNRKVLLVIAHPDDEVMFFTPVLLTLMESNAQITVLCLSNGNYEGMGTIRTNELIKSLSMFQIPAKDVHILEDPQLQDGMQNNWPCKVISDRVIEFIETTSSTMVITFDERGVSDHPNHIATYQGVRSAIVTLSKSPSASTPPILGLKLKSVNIIRKFSGILECLCALLSYEYVVLHFGLVTALRGMYIHRSQNLWYRQIFVLLSAFTYVNSFSQIT